MYVDNFNIRIPIWDLIAVPGWVDSDLFWRNWPLRGRNDMAYGNHHIVFYNYTRTVSHRGARFIKHMDINN